MNLRLLAIICILIQNTGSLNEREIRKIQDFIKKNYQEMYLKWANYSHEGFYGK